ncbi:MAG: hypothetical protein IJ138_08555, partial [Clostridia bacterium]|nr:hypothetical protein [Clostridia bacterium]
MENETSAGKSLRRWRVIAIVAICLLVVVCIAAALTLGLRCATATLKAAEQKTDSAAIPAATAAPLPAAQEPAPALPEKTLSGEEMLSLWTADARAKNELIAYIEAITDENGSDYIPTERRIAVFDLDG